MEIAEFWGLLGVPLVIAAVQAIKIVIQYNERFTPVVALVLAILLEVYVAFVLGKPLDQGAFTGVVVGLAAMGLYSGAKKLTE